MCIARNYVIRPALHRAGQDHIVVRVISHYADLDVAGNDSSSGPQSVYKLLNLDVRPAMQLAQARITQHPLQVPVIDRNG
jgi:hypothetical protein